MQPYDVSRRQPLVLQCGHSFCKACLRKMYQPLVCPTCRKTERRLVSNLPRNYGLVDAARLDLTAAFSCLEVGSSSELQRILLDDRELRLSDVAIGSGATRTVVEGSYEGQPVSAAQQCVGNLGLFPQQH
jgi:hypothetical protein